MNEYPWCTPQALGRLTLSQMLCLANEKPPGAPRELTNFEDLTKELAKIDAAETRWFTSNPKD
jgi:hypothetical protein